jgi:hypothetical protein
VAKNDDFMKSLSSNISKAPSFLRIYFQNSTAVVIRQLNGDYLELNTI